MPHVIVKLWPRKNEAQKRRLAEAIAREVTAILSYDDESVSRALEEVDAGVPTSTSPTSSINRASSTTSRGTRCAVKVLALGGFYRPANSARFETLENNVWLGAARGRSASGEFQLPCSPTNTRMAARAITRRADRKLRVFGITAAQFSILGSLLNHSGRSVTEMAAATDGVFRTMQRSKLSSAMRQQVIVDMHDVGPPR